MAQRPNQQLTHGTYDSEEVARMLEEGDLRLALCASLRLLSSALLESPRSEGFKQAHAALASMDVATDWPFGSGEELAQAARALKQGASETEDELVRDYTRLFRGPASLPAPPWGSVYMDRDQVMYGWTWVELRSWLRAQGIQGAYEENDPEDNFARMLALAATIAEERPKLLAEFLGDHLLCWSNHFLQLLEAAPATRTYEGLVLLARTTLADVQELLGIVPAERRFYR